MLDEIVSEFLIESYESLDQLDRDLLALEEASEDRERLSSVFRTIHTIKGTSGFLAFDKLERLTHVGENLLVPLRDGDLSLTDDIADSLLAMVDAVRTMLGSIESGNGEGAASYDDLISRLESLKSGDQKCSARKSAPAAKAKSATEKSARKSTSPKTRKKKTTPGKRTAANVQSSEKPDDSPETNAGKAHADDVRDASQVKYSDESRTDGPAADVPNATPAAGSSVADSTIRIDVHLLDRLMNLVGELVLARNQVMQFSQDGADPVLSTAAQRVNLITTELQEGVMKTRMQPIRNAWSKIPRVVRDLSHSCGKQVKVVMQGAETELDKTILEAIRDPLTHIVRNCVDHGIELPDERTAAGKPVEGTLLLRACHEGGHVIVEVADDGKGIDIGRIRESAARKNIISEEEAASISDREALQLILQPGFSTASEVTNISGRGVGMDVVKTNVEKIGGTLDIQTISGEGTTLRIKIPLTLAIVPALVITSDSERFCIPQVSLLELVRLDGDRVKNQIEVLHSVPVYRLRGQLLPLVYLDEQLGLRAPRTAAERAADESVNIVVLQAEDRPFGLVVNKINDTQEIVVKPLGVHLKQLPMYAGSTIMGDGAVALILDVIGIAQQSHVLAEPVSSRSIDSAHQDSDDATVRDTWLIVEPEEGHQAAIPLSSVARLEEIQACDIELAGNRQVVQYRGEIMPLTAISGYGQVTPTDGNVSIVVYNTGERNVGIGVGRIVDIVDQTDGGASDDRDQTRVISGRITQIVDLSAVAAAV